MSADHLIRMPDFFPSLINAMPDGFILRSVDGTIIEANISFCEMVDYDRSEVIGSRPPHPWWADEDRDNIKQLASRYLAGESADNDMVFTRKNGQRFAVAVTSAPLLDGDGQIIAYVGTLKDMTERSRQQRQLAFQARLIDQLQAGVIATDDDGVISLWNRGAEELYGWSAAEVIGVDIRNVLPGVGVAGMPSEALAALRGGAACDGEYTARRRDGSTFPVFVTDAPILDQAGNLVGIVGVSVNISERRRSEQRRNAQYEVARVLAEAEELGAGLRDMLAAIGTALDWSFGGFWALDDTHQVLRCLDIWRSPEAAAREVAPGLTDDWAFAAGQGLLGSIWQRRMPMWVADINEPAGFVRADEARASGFQSWLAFPVYGQRGVLGAVEFFSEEQREPEPELLALLTSFGRQIGQFVERKRAESALRESEDRFSTMADSAPVLLWVSGPDGVATWFNRVWLDFRGRTLDEEVGNGWTAGLHPDEFDRALAVYEQALSVRQPYTFEYRLRRHDGTYRWMLSSGVPRIAQDGAFEGFIGSCIDITDRRRAEEEQRFLSDATRMLAASLDYQTTLSNLAGLVVAQLADWCIVSVRSSDGSIEHSIVAHADPERAAWAQQLLDRYPLEMDAPHGTASALREGQARLYANVTDDEIQAVARDMEHLELLRQIGFESAMIVPIMARDRTLGAITIISSSQVRSYSEADLKLAEHLAQRSAIAIDNALLYEEARLAARERDQFLAVAAHELRSPLTSMKGFAQLLVRRAERQPLGEEWLRPLRTIDTQVNRVSNLVSRLLDVSRIEEHQLHIEVDEVDVIAVVREAVAEAQLGVESHRIVFEDTADTLLAEIDRSRIEQVLSNLIENAIKYSPEEAPIEVRVAPESSTVRISVTDYGSGVDPEAQERLFERYFRGKRSRRNAAEGLGLGLYVARGIVEAHGGTIGIESVPEQGSTFTFTLPLRQSQAKPAGE